MYIQMTVRELFTPCPRTKTQDSDPFGVIPFPIFSFAPAASNILLINYATSIYLSSCSLLIFRNSPNKRHYYTSLLKMTITLFTAYVKPQPDLKNLLLLTKCSCQALPPLLSGNIILKFDLTAMRLIYMIFIIIDTDKYDFTAISFQRLRVTSVFYLSNRRMHGFLIFQFYHNRRFIRVRKRQKHNISKTAACNTLQAFLMPLIFQNALAC